MVVSPPPVPTKRPFVAKRLAPGASDVLASAMVESWSLCMSSCSLSREPAVGGPVSGGPGPGVSAMG
ncbi:hypothetical protein PR003_g30919 [Phytophthora rubi]|uniref:Uncharacterized protein n=1 Tax=Phytophthora rubi TaxID=129364 RepID=A0A6A4BCN7_9STRA|nr:hypothetical protein PR003_g30919 [Phytophthora rubi]